MRTIPESSSSGASHVRTWQYPICGLSSRNALSSSRVLARHAAKSASESGTFFLNAFRVGCWNAVCCVRVITSCNW